MYNYCTWSELPGFEINRSVKKGDTPFSELTKKKERKKEREKERKEGRKKERKKKREKERKKERKKEERKKEGRKEGKKEMPLIRKFFSSAIMYIPTNQFFDFQLFELPLA